MVQRKDKSGRKDPAWKHSTQVDVGEGEKTYIYLKCNYCEKIVKGGVTRMKEHLSGSHKNVMPCLKVSESVKEEIRAYMCKSKLSQELAQRQFCDKIDVGSHFGEGGSGKDSSSSLPSVSIRGGRGPMDQYMMNTVYNKEDGSGPSGASGRLSPKSLKKARRNVSMDTGRFFYENAIPFNVATSPSYFNMLRSVGSFGRNFKPPSMYDLRTWVLKEEFDRTEKSVEEIKRTWSQTGVTIMSDGWSDIKSRSLINILVNNQYGTVFLRSVDASDKVKDANYIFSLLDGVVEEIGEHLVVQVVSDNVSAYKAAGKMLMEKRQHLYWTPCAAHCLDLILEKLSELPQHKNALVKAKKISKFVYNHSWVLALMRKFSKREIIRPAATRFATAYLTLQSLMEARQPLQAMFTSTQWMNSPWAKKNEGKEVRKIVLNEKFWACVAYAITTTKPLVHVLRLVDSEKVPAMGFIYNAMDEAKETIAQTLGGEEASYKEIWAIIDQKWEFQLHRYLHAAGYYLNPQFQYADNVSTNSEIKLGLYCCMDRLIVDIAEREKTDLQLIPFRNKEGFFGLKQARDTIKKRSPVEWWIQFGDGTPELQRFAIKVLGLTCSSSGCERNWSTYNQIHTKRRNRLSTLRMSSLVYIMYNKRLREKKLKKKALGDDEDTLICEDVPSDDEWLIDDDREATQIDNQQVDLNVECFDGVMPNSTNITRPTSNNKEKSKGKRKITDVDLEAEWDDLETTEEDVAGKTFRYADDSNEDSLSDDNDDNFLI